MKITVKSKINKNRCKNLTHLQVFTGQLRCLSRDPALTTVYGNEFQSTTACGKKLYL
jgi:hypothetical protein